MTYLRESYRHPAAPAGRPASRFGGGSFPSLGDTIALAVLAFAFGYLVLGPVSAPLFAAFRHLHQ